MAYNVGLNAELGKSFKNIEGVSTVRSALIGTFLKGPLDTEVTVYNITQLNNRFGFVPAPGSTSLYSAKGFFEQIGNGPLTIIRVASSSVAKSSKMLQDRQGAPANTLKIEAANEGLWGDKLGVEIDDSNILSTTLAGDILSSATEAELTSIEGLEVGSDIHLDDTTNEEFRRITAIDVGNNIVKWTTALTNGYVAANTTIKSVEFQLVIYENNVEVERFSGLSMNDDVSFFVEKKVNDISQQITVADQKAVDTDYQDLPAVTSSPSIEPLSGGHDGLSDITKADYEGVQANKTGVYALDAVDNLSRFCCPNPLLTDADPAAAFQTLTQSMISYAETRETLEYYGDVPYNKSIADAVTFAGNYSSRLSCLFYPWGKVTINQLPVWLPPSSLVMGAAIAKDYRVGVHKNVGNEKLNYFEDLERHVSNVEGNTLNDAKVNCIRRFTAQGIKVFGSRTLSADIRFRFIHVSELYNYIFATLSANLHDVIFEPNNEALWRSVVRRIRSFLRSEQQKGALFDASNPGGEAFTIKMDSDNNLQADIALGLGKCEVGFVPVGTLEKLIIPLTPTPSGMNVG